MCSFREQSISLNPEGQAARIAKNHGPSLMVLLLLEQVHFVTLFYVNKPNFILCQHIWAGCYLVNKSHQ